MKGMRCFLAIRPMASRSTMTPPGLAIDSTKMAFVRGVMALSKVEGSSESAQTTFQPKFL